jgi:hypothetical protein
MEDHPATSDGSNPKRPKIDGVTLPTFNDDEGAISSLSDSHAASIYLNAGVASSSEATDTCTFKNADIGTDTGTTSTSNTTNITATITPSPFDDIHLVKTVLSFVGDYQYRYVATVSRNFVEAHRLLYPINNGQTHYRTHYRYAVSTVEHVQMLYADFVDLDKDEVYRNPVTRMLCKSAARYGSLEVLQYLRSKQVNCPWDKMTCSMAAMYGHFELLQWAHNNDCPWDVYTCA